MCETMLKSRIARFERDGVDFPKNEGILAKLRQVIKRDVLTITAGNLEALLYGEDDYGIFD